MGSYSNSTICEKCGFKNAQSREENHYTVYLCPLCGWQEFSGDAESYAEDEGPEYNPTKEEIERAKRYILYIKISQLNFNNIIYDYDLNSYVYTEEGFMKKLLELVFIYEE